MEKRGVTDESDSENPNNQKSLDDEDVLPTDDETHSLVSKSSPELRPHRRRWDPCWLCFLVAVAIVLFAVLGYVVSVLVSGAVSGGGVFHKQAVISSPYDDRTYEYVQFDNGLQALLVSDPEAEIGAAALDVRVGSFYDPAEYAGLAHFLEHMLFLGTAKYPEQGEFSAYLSSHGGSSNAYTVSSGSRAHSCLPSA
jgi:hypothetical protein